MSATHLKVLITGASGIVGRNVSDYLARNGVDVIPTDLSGWPVSGNLLDDEFVFTKLASLDFDAVIHLAAITDIKKTIENPKLCFEVNCLGTLNMLELALKKNVSRFILSSSANVYGAPRRNPVSETTSLSPRVPYDYSKVICEQMATSFHKTKGLPVTITRSWLLFGEYDRPGRAVIRFISACLSGDPLTLFNAGRDTTAPSHALNYSKLALLVLRNEKAVSESFNFGGEKVVSVRQLAQMVKRLTKSDSELKLAPPRSEEEARPQVSYPSTSKVKKLLGYKYELTLEQGLMRTIEWVKSQSKQSG